MTLEEAIAHARAVASVQKDNCEQCAKDHEQLAEWLEELKDLRRCVKSNAFQDGYNKGKADAVDEFRKDIINKINFENEWLFDCKSNNADTDIVFYSLRSFVNDRAQQLKEKKNA